LSHLPQMTFTVYAEAALICTEFLNSCHPKARGVR
jgi:hypothetical protein